MLTDVAVRAAADALYVLDSGGRVARFEARYGKRADSKVPATES